MSMEKLEISGFVVLYFLQARKSRGFNKNKIIRFYSEYTFLLISNYYFFIYALHVSLKCFKNHFPVITSTSKQSLKCIGHGVETLIKSLFK